MPKSPWLSGGYNLSRTSTNGFLFSWRGIPRWDVSAYRRIPPHQSALFEGEWKIGTPHHFGTNKITTSFGRHKALEWWVKHSLQWESNPPTWGRTSHFLEILGGSQDLNLRDPFPNYQPRLPKAAGFPIEPPPTPDESSRECFRKNHATGKLLSKLDLLQRSNLGSWQNHREKWWGKPLGWYS